MDIAVSVIMPVHNSARYLAEALDGVINQTLKDIEIICVDDGSTDGSAEILRGFAERDGRVTILTQENKGAGAARNAGLAIARGKYLSFLDSDDLFEPKMLETACEEAEMYDADFVIFDADSFSAETGRALPSDYILRKDEIPQLDVFSVHDMPDRIFTFSYNAAWNKIYKRDFIVNNNIEFQEIFSNNDMLFTCAAIMKAKKIRCILTTLLHYRREVSGQLTSSIRVSSGNWPMLSAFEATYDFIRRCDCFEDVCQNFSDWSLGYLIDYLRRAGKYYDSEFKTIITEYWIPKMGRGRNKFFDNVDYLNHNEFLTPGYIEAFFEKPYVAVKILFELPKLPLARGCDLILYGAGIVGTDFYFQLLERGDFNVLAWVDGNAGILSAQGFPVIPPESIKNLDFDYILIAVLYAKAAGEITERLSALGVPPEKIVWAFADFGEAVPQAGRKY
jgi:glycosyltransferase involved in cell wall biosynthesis